MMKIFRLLIISWFFFFCPSFLEGGMIGSLVAETLNKYHAYNIKTYNSHLQLLLLFFFSFNDENE
jgi:hypothetical protein